MDTIDTDILDLGLRIESAGDARLARWLLAQVGAERVRLAALALRARRAPSPQRVGAALGLGDELPVAGLAAVPAMPPNVAAAAGGMHPGCGG